MYLREVELRVYRWDSFISKGETKGAIATAILVTCRELIYVEYCTRILIDMESFCVIMRPSVVYMSQYNCERICLQLPNNISTCMEW